MIQPLPHETQPTLPAGGPARAAGAGAFERTLRAHGVLRARGERNSGALAISPGERAAIPALGDGTDPRAERRAGEPSRGGATAAADGRVPRETAQRASAQSGAQRAAEAPSRPPTPGARGTQGFDAVPIARAAPTSAGAAQGGRGVGASGVQGPARAAGVVGTAAWPAGMSARRAEGRVSVQRPGPAPAMRSPAEQVRQALAHGAARAAALGRGSFALRVDAEGIGAVRVRVDLSPGRVEARFEVESESARGLLARSVGELRASLEALGLSVHRMSVEVADRSAEPPGTEAWAQQNATAPEDGGPGDSGTRPATDRHARGAERTGEDRTGGDADVVRGGARHPGRLDTLA